MHAASTTSALADRISLLLPAVEASATVSRKLVGSRHPELLHFDPAAWRFHVTIAGLWAAIAALPEDADHERTAHIEARVTEKINEWDRAGGSEAMADCSGFVSSIAASDEASGAEGEAMLSESLGLWVLSKLYQRTPSFREAIPAGSIGYLMMQAFGDWWEKPFQRRRD